MINKDKFVLIGISSFLALSVVLTNPQISKSTVEQQVSVKQISPLELVADPNAFLNSKIDIVATFDKFSTLGLDYKPAFRDSKDHIAFLIRRPDTGNTVMPLSELKLILPRDKAEKLIDLESGDQIEFTGSVFSSAMTDPWVDVDNVKILSSKSKTDSNKDNLDKKENITPKDKDSTNKKKIN